MAEQAEAHDADEFEDDLEPIEGDSEAEGSEAEGAADEDEAEEVEILIGDETAPVSEGKSEPDLIRTLRAANREQAKKLAAYERGELQPPKPAAVIEVGPKPTLEGCDYDDEKFVAEVEAWTERKRQAAEAEAQAAKGSEAAKAELAADFQKFEAGRKALGFRDYAEAEEEVAAKLTKLQQAAVIQGAKDAAKVIYALGKRPDQLNAVAAITNPVKFIAAIVQLEGNLKVSPKTRKAPALDTPVKGSAPMSGGQADKYLERLEREADRTGDRSKVVAYKRSLRRSA